MTERRAVPCPPLRTGPGRASARSAPGSLFPVGYFLSAFAALLFSATSLMNSVTTKASSANGAE